MDGTYSLIEVAPVVGVPESTLFRYRWQGKLLTAFDFSDEELKGRIMTAAIVGRELSVVLPDARFDLEDCTRLRVVGSLGDAGWDRQKLLDVLAWPYALPVERGGDLHSPRYPQVMPTTLAISSTRQQPGELLFRHRVRFEGRSGAGLPGLRVFVPRGPGRRAPSDAPRAGRRRAGARAPGRTVCARRRPEKGAREFDNKHCSPPRSNSYDVIDAGAKGVHERPRNRRGWWSGWPSTSIPCGRLFLSAARATRRMAYPSRMRLRWRRA